MLDTIPRGQIPKTEYEFGKKLINDKLASEISKDEFYKEVTYLALNCGFNELIPHLEPTRPDALFEYDNLDFKARKKVGEGFWRQKDISKYFNDKIRIKYQNEANRQWLEQLAKKLEGYGDYVNMEKVKTRLKMFTTPNLFRERKDG